MILKALRIDPVLLNLFLHSRKRRKLDKNNRADNYYEIQSRRAIQQAVEAATGKSLEGGFDFLYAEPIHSAH
jgi:hypothetical protein